MNSDHDKLELKESLFPVMHCLQPSWREEYMDEDGYWNDEIISKEEYFRIKDWWITSGGLEKLCHEFIDSFEPFFPKISTIGMNFLPTQDDWVAWVFEFFEWWPSEFGEFSERVIEGTWIDNLSYEYLNKCTREWWESSAPLRVLESALEVTKVITVITKDKG